ncbi:outer membrane beta-barrel protein [Winogradskyella ludwigii]|jgi:hypothetical protein|uniref:outer membrane beta-barrel protein n=1 Tax=Winogradskyella ludwigii TaxID=2686076 RepID=UPI0015C92B45|nr:outer membrane beta-barrel protein [Winogradskyella ludwigii]
MKKIFFLTLLLAFTLNSFAQRSRDKGDLYLSVGVNAINTLGTQSPFNDPEDWSYKTPISVALEFNWSEKLAIEQSITFNGFDTSSRADFSANTPLEKDYNYLSIDTNLKYYFGEHIFGRKAEWFDIYADAGIGFFHIDETNISANLGGGVLFWLNRYRTIGLRAQTIAKFAFNHSDSGYDNNHYQYHLQLIIKL